MSKPAVRIVFAVLICLAIVAAIFASVQAASNAGLAADGQNYSRRSSARLQMFDASSFDKPAGSGHGGCEDEGISPSDY